MDVNTIQQIKNDLAVLNNLPENCYQEICQLGYNYVVGGQDKASIKLLASSHNVDTDDIENAITSIALLFFEIYKSNVPEDILKKEMSELLPSKASDVIFSLYQRHEIDLNNNWRGHDFHSTSYKNLEWRLESQLASRSLRGGYQPRVVMKLSLEKFGKEENIALVSDIPNIIHWNKMVEEALSEARTQNSRRLQRATM